MTANQLGSVEPRGLHSFGGLTTVLILAGSLALNVFLGLRAVRQPAEGRPPEPESLAKGEIVVDLPVSDLDGKAIVVAFAGSAQPTLLYLVSPACAWCHKNEANFAAIATAAASSYRIVIASTLKPGFAEYAERIRKQLGKDVKAVFVTGIPNDLRQRLKLGGTPQLIVIDREARVLASWIGAPTPGDARAIGAFFGIALPGLGDS